MIYGTQKTSELLNPCHLIFCQIIFINPNQANINSCSIARSVVSDPTFSSSQHLILHCFMLYAFFWVIPRHLKCICQRFGTLCLFHLHSHAPTRLWRWNRQSVPKHQNINFRCRGITQKKAYNIQYTAKVWNQDCFMLFPLSSCSLVAALWRVEIRNFLEN